MISGKAIIECGTGSVASTTAVNTITGTGVVGMRSCTPAPIGTRDLEQGEFESIMDSAEVMFFFHNIESLDVVIGTFTRLRNDMVEERKRLDMEENDE